MVWAIIGVGFRHIVVLPPRSKDDGKVYRMNSDGYVRQCLSVPAVMKKLRQPGSLFMQDGAKCHTSKQTVGYLQGKGVNFIEDWPPRSPQLNPIENLWSMLARAVSDRGAASVQQLRNIVIEEFNKIEEEKIDNMVLDWKKRLKECYENDGELE
jgi:hypothetical protein